MPHFAVQDQPSVDFCSRNESHHSLEAGGADLDNLSSKPMKGSTMTTSMSETLATLRGQHHLTQDDVARHLGITKAAVSKWECGQSLPDITLLPSIAQLYGVSLDDLFGLNKELTQDQPSTHTP